MISVYRWHSESRCGSWETGLPTDSHSAVPDGEIWWIDLERPTEEEERRVFEQFRPVHALTHEDIIKLRREPEGGPHLPKVEEFPDYLLVIANPILPLPTKSLEGGTRPGTVANTQLSAVLTDKLLITHHADELSCIAHARRFVERHAQQAGRGPDFLLHLILDATVDEYAPELDRLADRLDALEETMFDRPKGSALTELMLLKRRVSTLRKSLILEREVLSRLTRSEFELVDDREIAYYRNVYDHLVRYTELIESAREMVSDLMQTYLASVSNQLNRIMKALATVSTIILPMTLVTGIYGMNFENMPETKWPNGYFLALLMIVAVGFGSALVFRWRRWL